VLEVPGRTSEGGKGGCKEGAEGGRERGKRDGKRDGPTFLCLPESQARKPLTQSAGTEAPPADVLRQSLPYPGRGL
jgi:hypothetical protein